MVKKSKIKNIKAREILDSRGNPTIEVALETDFGVFRASVPSGASKGSYEAMELRDGGTRYRGLGVTKAIKNVEEKIFPKIKNQDPKNQEKIDKIMIELDNTPNKSNLGANAILAVSMAVCRAGAAVKKLPLYLYINKYWENGSPNNFPLACFNVINGGAHAGNNLEIQEFMVIPQEKSFAKNLQVGCEIYQSLKEILKKVFDKRAINVGDEGGFAPQLSRDAEALDLLVQSMNKSKHNVKIGLDCAASQFYRNDQYKIDDKVFFRGGLLLFYEDLLKKYPLIFLEDPFAEGDWQGFENITKEMGANIDVFGDDLLTTNIERIKRAQKGKACNGLVLKINQIGTITEALEAAKLAKLAKWRIMVAHRSGETNDDFIADLAVGISADYIKSGAPARGERVAKYNRLLAIEEEVARR